MAAPSGSQSDSEGTDEEDTGSTKWKWSELSPFALTAALPEDTRPSDELCQRLRWIRLFWWNVLLVVYALLLLVSSTDRELSSALRQEAVEELFPDWNKAAERMKEGAKTPELKELLHVADVSTTLSLFNDRCRDQSFVSTSLKAVWECKLFDVVVNGLSGAEWDPAMNRHLPDSDSDNVFGHGKKGVFETKIDASSRDLAQERRREMDVICSDIFFQNHVVIGDDPKLIPRGDATAFSEKVVKPATQGGSLHPDFDANTIRGFGQTAIMDSLAHLHNDEQETRKDMEKITRALHLDLHHGRESAEEADSLLERPRASSPAGGHGSARLHRRNPWLIDVDAEDVEGDRAASSASLLQAKEDGSAMNESARQEEREKVAEDDAYYGPGCFDSHDVAGLLRDLWASHIGDGGQNMNMNAAKAMLKEVLPNMTSASLERLWQSINVDDDGNGSLSAKEFLDFAENHLRELQFPVRGYLNLECRNHHFSLLGLCKPASISVLYQIGFVPTTTGSGLVQGISGTRMHIRMIFSQIEPGSGWYKADLRILVKSQVGNISVKVMVLMAAVLTLCLVLTLFDTALTLVLLPLNLLRVLKLDLPSSTSYEEIEHMLWLKVLCIVDARGVLSRTSASLVILSERLIGIFFAAACVQAAREAVMPNSMPMGGMSEQCVYAWLRANKEWIINSVKGNYVEHGLSVLTYVHECTSLHGVEYVGELAFQLLFEEEGSYHALVVGLVFLRVLESFNLSYRLRWLPRTIFLAKFKLINFVIAYVALVAGFALLMTLYFGELYMQYSTLDRSFHTLLVYSFGMTERATYGMKPFIERSGGHLYAALFVFSVFMVTIILNMFTTIVIDAFAAEGDPDKFSRMYQEEVRGLTHSLLSFFGKGHVVARQLRKTHRLSVHKLDQGQSSQQSRGSLASLLGQQEKVEEKVEDKVEDKEVKEVKEQKEAES
ncbi:unnamed protein product [Symbiodinium natans]|uniref:EF-hand domain-containing protein n=1 Tax=Symbiodinium natans TaxID=878477 RepID=A0A812MIB8_9DINO|nr:unnamed protein product [Symbiodinium natans]